MILDSVPLVLFVGTELLLIFLWASVFHHSTIRKMLKPMFALINLILCLGIITLDMFLIFQFVKLDLPNQRQYLQYSVIEIIYSSLKIALFLAIASLFVIYGGLLIYKFGKMIRSNQVKRTLHHVSFMHMQRIT